MQRDTSDDMRRESGGQQWVLIKPTARFSFRLSFNIHNIRKEKWDTADNTNDRKY